MTDHERIVDLEARLAIHREACAVMYQFAGMFIPYGVPTEILDNLSALAQGKQSPHEWPMPIGVETVDRMKRQGAAEELRAQFEALLREADQFEKATNLAMRGIALRFKVRAAELEGES